MSVQCSPIPSGASKCTSSSQIPSQSAEVPRLATPAGDIELQHIWSLLRNMQEHMVSMQEQNRKLAEQNDKLLESVESIENEQIEEREALSLLKERTNNILQAMDSLRQPKTPPLGTTFGAEATPHPMARPSSSVHSPTPIRPRGVTFMPGPGSPTPKLSPSPHTDSAAARTSIAPILAHKPLKMKEPDSFDGTRGRATKQWWTRVAVWANFQRPNYPTETALVLHILTLMKPGKAANWAKPIIEKVVSQDATSPQTINALGDLFHSAFADPNASRAAVRLLGQLHQTVDANTYTMEFNNLASDLEWNDEAALKAQYEQGLAFRVKAQLIQRTPYPATLAALQEAAIKIDGLYQELDQSNPRRKAQGPTDEKGKSREGAEKKREVMSLEEHKKLPNYVSEDERKARKEAGLCIKCGSPDHMFQECRNGWRKERAPGKGKETAKIAEETESEKE